MKTLSPTTHNFLKSLFFALCLSAVAFGCEKEIVCHEGNTVTAEQSAYHHIQRPPVQCGPSVFTTLKDGPTSFGSVEVLNNSSELYLIFNLNQYKFLEEFKVFTGALVNMPMDSDGNVNIEGFAHQQILSSPANDYTLVLPLNSMPACSDIAIWARVSTRNMFGQVTATNYTWMSGTPISNGFKVSYCATTCLTGNSNSGSTL